MLNRKFFFILPFAILILIVSVALVLTYPPSTSTYLQSEKTPVVDFFNPIHVSQTASGLPPIDCIYVINLQRRFEKWIETQRICESHGLHPNRVDAIDGIHLSEKEKKDLMGPYAATIYPGEMGCILSHLSAIKDGYERGFQTIWILEDDIQIDADIQKIPKLLSELSNLDPDWDIFYTDLDQKIFEYTLLNKKGYFLFKVIDPRPDQRLKPLRYYLNRATLSENLQKSGLRYGAYSMIISKSGMEKILNYFTHVYIWAPYDLDIHYIPNIHEYSSIQSIVSQPINQIHDTRNRRGGDPKTRFRRACRTIWQLWDDYTTHE